MKRHLVRLGVLFSTFALAGAMGCFGSSGPAGGNSCRTDADCASGLTCVLHPGNFFSSPSSTCVQRCACDGCAPCPSDQSCDRESNECEEGTPTPLSVTIDADQGPPLGPDGAYTGAETKFHATVDGGSGTVTSYQWSFGDGGKGSGESTTYAFPKAGKFTVRVTITDANGGTATATQDEYVCSNEPRPCIQSSDCCIGIEGDFCNNGTCSDHCGVRGEPCGAFPGGCCEGSSCIDVPADGQKECQSDTCLQAGGSCLTDNDCCIGLSCGNFTCG